VCLRRFQPPPPHRGLLFQASPGRDPALTPSTDPRGGTSFGPAASEEAAARRLRRENGLKLPGKKTKPVRKKSTCKLGKAFCFDRIKIKPGMGEARKS